MNVFKIIGILLIIFGVVDFAGPHLGFDSLYCNCSWSWRYENWFW